MMHAVPLLDVQAVGSAADPRVGDYLSLTDTALRRRREPAEGLFIAEGAPVITRALRAGYPLRSVLCEQRWLDSCRALVAAATARATNPGSAGPTVPCYVAPADMLRAITGFHVHRGALAAFGRLPLTPFDRLMDTARRLLVVEDSNNPTNLGAVFRCAAALWMDGVVLSPGCADPLYRRCVRVSMGEVFALPYARLADWPGGLRRLGAAGYLLLALTPATGAEPLDAVVRSGLPDRVAVLLGAEGPGLSAGALAAAHHRVRIPMAAGVDSLNLAAAAAVACYLVGLPGP